MSLCRFTLHKLHFPLIHLQTVVLPILSFCVPCLCCFSNGTLPLHNCVSENTEVNLYSLEYHLLISIFQISLVLCTLYPPVIRMQQITSGQAILPFASWGKADDLQAFLCVYVWATSSVSRLFVNINCRRNDSPTSISLPPVKCLL